MEEADEQNSGKDELLLKNDDTTKHVIGIDPDDESQVIEVWVRTSHSLTSKPPHNTCFVLRRAM